MNFKEAIAFLKEYEPNIRTYESPVPNAGTQIIMAPKGAYSDDWEALKDALKTVSPQGNLHFADDRENERLPRICVSGSDAKETAIAMADNGINYVGSEHYISRKR